MLYCMYFIPILSLHVHIQLLALNRENFTTILECKELQGQGKWIANFCRNEAPKKCSKIQICSLLHTIHIPHGVYTVWRPCDSLLVVSSSIFPFSLFSFSFLFSFIISSHKHQNQAKVSTWFRHDQQFEFLFLSGLT